MHPHASYDPFKIHTINEGSENNLATNLFDYKFSSEIYNNFDLSGGFKDFWAINFFGKFLHIKSGKMARLSGGLRPLQGLPMMLPSHPNWRRESAGTPLGDLG